MGRSTAFLRVASSAAVGCLRQEPAMQNEPADTCEYSDYFQTLIRVKARKAAKRPEFRQMDPEEIMQDLFVRVWSLIGQYDPSRGSLNTFLDRIADTQILIMRREQRRLKRRPATGQMQSLEMLVPQVDAPPVPLGEILSRSDLDRRTGNETAAADELFETREDIASLLELLPPELRALCIARVELNRAEATEDLGLSRRGYDTAMQTIREQFAMNGFGEI